MLLQRGFREIRSRCLTLVLAVLTLSAGLCACRYMMTKSVSVVNRLAPPSSDNRVMINDDIKPPSVLSNVTLTAESILSLNTSHHRLYTLITSEERPSTFIPDESSFNVPNSYLNALQYPLTNLVNLDKTTLENFVFVTAASRGFFQQSLDTIATVQKHYPDRKIIFYDLELSAKGKQKKKDVESYCNVEYREFPYSEFPPHVSKLRTYAWKPLLIHMVLREYAGVFWMDSSARMLSGNMTDVYTFVTDTGGVMLFNYGGATNFQVTHHRTYDYLPTNITRQKYMLQYEANIMILYRTPVIYNDVIKWWVLCALTQQCIAPIFTTACRFHGKFEFANCHRFDQTTLNILLTNKYEFDYTNFARHLDNFEVIKRSSKTEESMRQCM